MARNKKVEILSHDGQVLHPITDGDCVIFPDGETLARKLSEDEAVMYTPEVVNSSPMFKVGEGDSSDYSANVLDGAYQEAVLKGQTYVNTIQEPSADVITLPTPFTEYERTQSKTFTEMQDGTFGLNLVGQSYVNSIQEPSEPSYVALGENLEFQNKKVEYTNDGQIKSAMLKGQTLVNLATTTNFSMTTSGSVAHLRYTIPTGIYTIMADVTLSSDGSCMLRFFEGHGQAGANTKIFTSSGKYIWTENITNGNIGSYGFYVTNNETTDVTYTLNNLVILSGDHTQEDIPYFEGMQSVTMSTELENVCGRYNSSVAKNGKTFTVGTIHDRTLGLSGTNDITNYAFKQNTKYLMQFKISNLNLDGLSSIELIFSNSNVASGNSLFGNNTNLNISKNGIYRTVLTTSSIVNTSSFVIKGNASQWEGSTSTTRKLTISQIMCIEYQNGMENWDLPYFETTQLMKPLKVQSVNKNLLNPSKFIDNKDIAATNGTIGAESTTMMYDEYIPVDTSKSYYLKRNDDSGHVAARFYDMNKNYLGYPEGIKNKGGLIDFTGFENTKFIRFRFIKENFSANSIINCTQFEESSTITPYTPHQEKTTSALEPITLRAIGNVKDTLDLSTGEYVQRIGEIEFDGSDDERWMLYDNSTTNTISFRTTLPNGKTNVLINTEKYLCDKFPVLSQGTALNNKETEWTFYNLNGMCIVFFSILRSKLTTEDLVGFKNYISQNPIKVQYELANPITRKISLEYPNLQTYQDITHVQSIAMDGTLIPNIYLPSDIAYKTLLKPNTKYNLQLKQNVVNADNPLRVNVGGTEVAITQPRTLITTPSTLSNETLTFSGKGNRIGKVMLIENSSLLNGDIPYFEGIGDVHLGRVVENLCMANESYAGSSATTNTLTNNEITCKATSAGSRVVLFDFTKPIQNGKKYFVYAPCSKMFAIGIRTFYNNITYYDVAKTNITNYAILSVDNSILNDCKLFIGELGTLAVNATMTIRRPIVCEYIDGMENWDWESIGYFTGTKNIGNEFMRIGNKNLFDSEINYGSVNFNAKNYPWYTGVSKSRAYGNRIYKIKNNTNYTVSLNLTEKSNYKIAIHFSVDGYTLDYDSTWHTYPYNFNSHEYNYISLYFARQDDAVITDSEIANLKKAVQLEEASSATSYVAHKHNALYLPKDESIALSFVQGGIDFAVGTSFNVHCNSSYTHRIRTGLIDLEPNETYRISIGSSEYYHAFAMYDNSNLGSYFRGVLKGDYYFTTTKDVHKFAINVAKTDNTNLTPSALHQIRLEKVTDVHLRSIGSVKDELDLTRGVYVQRIGEIVIDGNSSQIIYTADSEVDTSLYQPYTLNKTITNCIGYTSGKAPISDKIKTITQTGYRFYTDDLLSYYSDSSACMVGCFKKSTLNGLTPREWFQQNPTTIQYELKTPIEHKIHIPMKNESNQTIAKPNGVFTLPLMYSEVNHVDLAVENVLPKVQSRDYISYPVIASPSNKYTVFHNKVGSTDLTVNLCGTSTTVNTHKNTITTPSSISQYELRLSGANNKVSNVCVFNGDYMNVNVPYVQGMMNAVNPTVKNVGENLLDNEKLILGGIAWTTGEDWKGTDRRRSDYLRVKPNTRYVISFHNCSNANTGVGEYDISKTFVCSLLSGNGKNDIIFTTKPSTYFIRVVTPLDGKTLLKEASTPSQYEPYKENNCKPDYGQVYLTQDMLEQGAMYYSHGNSYSSMINNTETSRIRLKKLLCLKENTTYVIKIDSDYMFALGLFNENEISVSSSSVSTWRNEYVFTTTSDACKLGFCIRKSSNRAIGVSEFNDCNITLYELDKEITLRSLPNGVRDELNLETGEYIQRIGEIVLDGSENWTNGNKGNEYTTLFAVTGLVRFDDKNVNFPAISDRYVYNVSLYGEDNVVEGFFTAWSGFYIRIGRDKVSTNIEDFKQYLSQNPITVQYELKEPIVKDIVIHNYPHSYQNGHVIIESGDPTTSVPAQLTYKCVTNRSGQIQEHTEQVEKQERQINELETLILENIRQNQNRSQNFLTSLISTLEIEEE